MTDAPRPPTQAIKPPPKPTEKPKFRGAPVGEGSGRAEHTLKPHVDATPGKI